MMSDETICSYPPRQLPIQHLHNTMMPLSLATNPTAGKWNLRLMMDSTALTVPAAASSPSNREVPVSPACDKRGSSGTFPCKTDICYGEVAAAHTPRLPKMGPTCPCTFSQRLRGSEKICPCNADTTDQRLSGLKMVSKLNHGPNTWGS
jgi:hypothetical protein